jgi:hypothetical protein
MAGARRRPAGRLAPTQAGSDEPRPREPRPHRADDPQGGGRPTSGELDERERRQSTKRKPKGPAKSPVSGDDVLIEKPQRIPPTATTADVPPADPR